jgi:hypothetical protein
MLRKSLLALIAATTIGFGLTASSEPADAKVFISLGFGSPYYYAGPYYGGPYYGSRYHRHHYGYYQGCGWKKVYVKKWSHKRHKWVKVRTSRRVCY